MLIRLLLLRLSPLLLLSVCKERKHLKLAMICLSIIYAIIFLTAVGKILAGKRIYALLYLLPSMFPHYIFYGFSIWILLRCVWHAWSLRVWKRIYGLAVIAVLTGIFAETYWNPYILQFFYKIIKYFS